MDLNHLRSFVSVAELGHLTRASEALHLSQPAVSGHIKTLEDQFGVMLFERTPSGMALTPAGRRLVVEAEQILGAVRRLAQSAQDMRGQLSGTVKLGTVLDPSVVRVGELTAQMLSRYPHVELELHHVISNEALARVRNGSFDAAFYFGARPENDLDSVALREMVYRVMLPSAWAEQLSAASWATLALQPWIVAPEPSSHHRLVMDLFNNGVPRPERIIEADNESVIINLVESGVGVSLIRDEMAAQSIDQGRIVAWPGEQITTTLLLVHTVDDGSDALIAALRDVLHDVWSTPRQRG